MCCDLTHGFLSERSTGRRNDAVVDRKVRRPVRMVEFFVVAFVNGVYLLDRSGSSSCCCLKVFLQQSTRIIYVDDCLPALWFFLASDWGGT